MSVAKALESEFSRQELLDIVSRISALNRIQGSKELEEAAKVIVSMLEEVGGSTEIKMFSYDRSYGTILGVVGWDVQECEVRMLKPKEKLLHTFLNSKTVVVAHSPSGDVEAEVVYVGEGVDEAAYRDVVDKIVLSYGPTRTVYWYAVKHGAVGVMFFRRNAPSDAVPYRGLFLLADELPYAKIPAVCISRTSAYEIINLLERGEKVVVRLYVKAQFRSVAQAPAVIARIGDGDREIHLSAHICHPGGTVNDNASGAALLVELYRALMRGFKRGYIDPPNGISMVFVWIPEYFGTAALLDSYDVDSILINVNLDMVGERQEITGSTLLFVGSPMFMYNDLQFLLLSTLLKALRIPKAFSIDRRILSYRFDVIPYECGSDHDVYLGLLKPAIMINSWPDKYYHTDMDTIDKFDPELVKRIAIAVTNFVYNIKPQNKHTSKFFDTAMAIGVLGDIESLDAILERIDLARKVLEAKPSGKTYRTVAKPALVSTRYVLRRLGFENGWKLLREFERRGEIYIHLFEHYIPKLLLSKPMDVGGIAKMVFAEYGVKLEQRDVENMLKHLQELGIVEEV